ncbi:D-alanyl-D-alanine carboxypeptidase, serine-type, PBP4 family [Actinoalloteichus sp. GBA129-24]|uniref:D-alanyl-D-alanine carboxypeptidase, serine-type, PBP4 family n=2 Tax=Actinoalloteichus TaxID=65496 RepID=A0AAC9L8M3_9PSEU|nr:D-alanyl-D-alanine carboxypeptidase/D-alanyl-D-alanine-endopeptidase [Actinoalloteichus fjordicus]APU12390.1 D-alanyl-D-alanine carboxypeptidase, serine-type, PBP4 family [Actinoalloteichus fjordicus]APU18342.1 D-alanyl-D-alanine carboxypeptidase, serine-type, PBP4 family [Actinoalloteichus sp. GBA129-24]
MAGTLGVESAVPRDQPADAAGQATTVALRKPGTELPGESSPRSHGTRFEPAEEPAVRPEPDDSAQHDLGGPPTSVPGGSPPVDSPPAGPENEDEPPRRRRGLLVGALVATAVVALAVTSVFTVDPVGRIFGLGGPAVLPTSPAPAPITPQLVLHGVDPAAAGPTEEGLSAALAPVVGAAGVGTLHGVVVDPASGQSLWSASPTEPAVPASTTKILTSAAVLLALPADHTFDTTVVAGAEPGTVILVGGGDFALTATPEGTTTLYSPEPARIADLAAQVLENSGGEPITEVLVDVSRYSGPARATGWDDSDAPSTYGGFVEPLMLDGGRSDPLVEPSVRLSTPASAAGQALADELGGATVSVAEEPAAAEAAVLGEVQSPPLVDLVEAMMLVSDNVAAEMLARELALHEGEEPTYEGAAAAITTVLGENGFDVSQLSLFDASGLSRDNLITPNLLGDILSVTVHPIDESDQARSAALRPMLTGLPVAGASGTLADRYQTGSAAGRGWVQAKTGTLSSVNTLAGVVTDQEGKLLVFALLSSGTSVLEGRPALDAVATALRECGCR